MATAKGGNDSIKGGKAQEAQRELIKLDRDELSELTSFDDAIQFLTQAGYDVGQAEDLLGDGFSGIEKRELVNIPFLIVDAVISMSEEFNAPFAVIRAMTATNKRVRFTDGSTGVCTQVQNLIAKRAGGAVGVMCPKGLTASEYKICTECGRAINGDGCEDHPDAKQSSASTYYIAL